jgi:hypothetical protein
MSKIIGKVRFDAQTKKINSGVFSLELNYTYNIEYNEMLKNKNYIEVSKEQSDLLKSNNEKGIEMCVIDGKIQEYVELLEVKLENAKAKKIAELKTIYSNDKTWECTLKNTTNSITKTKQWFVVNLSLSMEFETDQKTIITLALTQDKYFMILNLLSAFGTKVFNVNKDLQTRINLATKVLDIDAINIEAEFAKINKIITVA